MKAIIFNINRALIIDVTNINQTGNRIFFEYSELKTTINVSADSVMFIDADIDVVKTFAESLVGENGEVTCYNLKEKSTSVKKVSTPNTRSTNLTKKLTNK